MRKYGIAAVLMLLAPLLLPAQHTSPQSKPLLISGRLLNCPDKVLFVYITDKSGHVQTDTIKLDANGNFTLRSRLLSQPGVIHIRNKMTQINDIYAAPGYEIRIDGDASDSKTLFKTTSLGGSGKSANTLRQLERDHYLKQGATASYTDLTEEQFAIWAKQQRKTKDSLLSIAFSGKDPQDSYQDFFRDLVRVSDRSRLASQVIDYATIHGFDPQKLVAFTRANSDVTLLDHISNDEYLASSSYKSLVTSSYKRYKLAEEKRVNPSFAPKGADKLTWSTGLFTGKVKEYVLFSEISNSIYFAKTADELSALRQMAEPLISKTLPGESYAQLNVEFIRKDRELGGMLTGKPAPVFSLKDPSGKLVSLKEFAGKVVYIDFWASWCGPCRAETPAMKELVSHYKGDDRLVIVSIAVQDNISDWKKAMAEDSPTWLQLNDHEGFAFKAYMASSIPMFVLVDKTGKILSMDAPRPSDKTKIRQAIDEALAR